uniref:Uncharacterized protein n=1 Tax=Lutzomyia longipalpis TaxID=7200 RepID=A0A7G3B3T3_LUTLO
MIRRKKLQKLLRLIQNLLKCTTCLIRSILCSVVLSIPCVIPQNLNNGKNFLNDFFFLFAVDFSLRSQLRFFFS